jgi:hypothetical protein
LLKKSHFYFEAIIYSKNRTMGDNIPVEKMSNSSNDNPNPETIVASGIARLPKEIVGEGKGGFLSIELEVSKSSSEIVDFSCTVVSRLGEKILRDALLGHEMDEGIENAVNQVEKRFFSVIKKATIAALGDARLSYKRIQK